MRRKRIITIALAASLIAAIGIGGTAAYLTDNETATNSFTVGSIETELTEPQWDAWNDAHDGLDNNGNPNPAEDTSVLKVVPDQEIPKDPTVTNIGDNDAFVFMTVKVPVAYNTVTASEDGRQINAGATQLFGYTAGNDWKLVQVSNAAGPIATSSTNVKNATGEYAIEYQAPTAQAMGSITYLYAYTGGGTNMKRLYCEANANNSDKPKTATLFPAVQLVNAIEDQGLEESVPQIVINSYAIQADFINDGDTAVDGTNGGTSKTAPADVWDVVRTQRSIGSNS